MSSENIANRDSAEQCAAVGKAALQAGDLAKAIRFLEKSLLLYPIPGVKELLVAAQKKSQSSSSNSSSSSSSSSSSNNNSSSRNSSGGSSSSSSRPNMSSPASSEPSSPRSPNSASSAGGGSSHSQEQEDGAKKILRAAKRSHYEVLGISKSAKETDIKKAYRGMARLYHPDRNKAPSAEAAFKAINTANDTLMDNAKREAYDTYGHDDSIINGNSSGGGGGGGGGYRPYHQNEMSPDDIFRMFFSGGVPNARNHRQHPGYANHQAAGGEINSFKQLIPIIIFVLFIILSSFGNSPEQVYSFSKQSPYVYSYKTSSQHDVVPDIPFYTSIKSFDKEYQPSSNKRRNLEKNIERDYSDHLYYKCLTEKERRQAHINRANNDWTGRHSVEQAKAHPTPSCDLYNEFFVPDKNKKKSKSSTTTTTTATGTSGTSGATTSSSTTGTSTSSGTKSSPSSSVNQKSSSSTTSKSSSNSPSCEGVTLPVVTSKIDKGKPQTTSYFQCEGSHYCCISDCYKQNLAECGSTSFCGCQTGTVLFNTYISTSTKEPTSLSGAAGSAIQDL